MDCEREAWLPFFSVIYYAVNHAVKEKTLDNHMKIKGLQSFKWCLQEEITLFHLISKTPKSLKINDITSFLL